jgi:hypothetical protein
MQKNRAKPFSSFIVKSNFGIIKFIINCIQSLKNTSVIKFNKKVCLKLASEYDVGNKHLDALQLLHYLFDKLTIFTLEVQTT